MERNMDLGFINIQMERYMRGNGEMENKRVRVLWNILMVDHREEYGNKAKEQIDNIYFLTTTYTLH